MKLGIKPIVPGCAKVIIAPNLGPLSYIRGTVPTPHGDITIFGTPEHMEVVLPGSIEYELLPPSGCKILVTQKS